MSKKEKLPLYLSPEKKATLERRYTEDGSRNLTGFIVKSVELDMGLSTLADCVMSPPPGTKSEVAKHCRQMTPKVGEMLQVPMTTIAQSITLPTFTTASEMLQLKTSQLAGTSQPQLQSSQTHFGFLLVNPKQTRHITSSIQTPLITSRAVQSARFTTATEKNGIQLGHALPHNTLQTNGGLSRSSSRILTAKLPPILTENTFPKSQTLISVSILTTIGSGTKK